MRFNPDDFKKWVEEHAQQFDTKLSKKSVIIGTLVESKISPKKLMSSIDVQEGDIKSICKTFFREGGTVKEIDGNDVLIEVKEGTFIINEKSVRIQ